MNHIHLPLRLFLLWTANVAGATASAPIDVPQAAPLPFPIYVASKIDGTIEVDGRLSEPTWRQTALGWGLSHGMEPNILCPDATLFRIGWNNQALLISLACYKRDIQDDLPENIWKPQEPEIIDTQAVPRHDRERGVVPPVNTADVLISRDGRTVTISFAPPAPPSASVHDSVGSRPLDLKIEHAYQGGSNDGLWTVEARVTWQQLGFEPPTAGEDWALNIYRDIRFFSNWAFIAWMRDWGKAEYSRYDLVERFGRVLFVAGKTDDAIDKIIKETLPRRGPVRVFATDALVLAEPNGQIVRQRYGEQVEVLKAYAEGIHRQRSRISNDLPYHPFFTEKKPREHLALASRRLARLTWAVNEKPLWDDLACTVALISHAIPEAREGLSAYKKERLYRGLFE
ncbi:MAG: hypothetical protein ACUVXJ_06725 [Phycisphaerae bacterium]